jgi:predicted transcriptional regulator
MHELNGDNGSHPLADRMQVRLSDLGLSLSDLARRSDVSLSYISLLTRGHISYPQGALS